MMELIGATICFGACGAIVGYLIGFRAGVRQGRPSWDEKSAREIAAWQDGVTWGRYLEQNKAELGL